tara:strand:- start:9538 stop:10221 length:684 start_codon:yes stop_codon:yes gene_type:complete
MLMKVISLDIETMNLNLRMENIRFGNPFGWKTSCACIYDGLNEQGYYYVLDKDKIIQGLEGVMDNHPVKKQIIDSLYNFSEMEQHLLDFLNKDYALITHNGYSFDLPILSKPISEGGANLKNVLELYNDANKNIDTCDYLRKLTGYRFKLQNLIKGILGDNESKFMDASYAPRAWKQKKYLQVLGYCMGDSIYTYQVYDDVKNTKCFTAIVKHNKKEFPCEVENVDW